MKKHNNKKSWKKSKRQRREVKLMRKGMTCKLKLELPISYIKYILERCRQENISKHQVIHELLTAAVSQRKGN